MKDMAKKKSGFRRSPETSHYLDLKYRLYLLVNSVKQLRGDPHGIALGMAIGVFIAFTPTIPFHTVLALGLAFLLRASKPAAYIGIWFSNPVTIPFMYLASYKVGVFMLPECSTEFSEVMSLVKILQNGDVTFSEKWMNITGFIEGEMDVLIAMNLGGVVLAIGPGIAAYIVTYRMMCRMQQASDSRNPEPKQIIT